MTGNETIVFSEDDDDNDLRFWDVPRDRVGIGTWEPTRLEFESSAQPMVSFGAGPDPGTLVVSAPGHTPITLNQESVIHVITELLRLAYAAPREKAAP